MKRVPRDDEPAYDARVWKRRVSITSLGVGLVAISAVACGDSPDAPPHSIPVRDAAIDAAIDVPPGVADLRPVAERMIGSAQVTREDIPADDCQVVEHCVTGTGSRKLLRFATLVGNFGTADLVMPAVPAAGDSDAIYEWAPCHGKHHVRDFATFELRDASGVVAVQRKQAFCLEDDAPVVAGAQKTGYACTRQGISVGWADVYAPDLACEYIDVTDQPAGAYTLRITVDPDHLLPDADRSNNVFEMAVDVPADPPPASP